MKSGLTIVPLCQRAVTSVGDGPGRRTLAIQAVEPVDLAVVKEIRDDGRDVLSGDTGSNVLTVTSASASADKLSGIHHSSNMRWKRSLHVVGVDADGSFISRNLG